MTLKVQDILAVDRPDFRLFYRVQVPTTLTQACQVVAAGTEMHGDQLVPMGAVGRFPRWFTHSSCSRSPKNAAGREQPASFRLGFDGLWGRTGKITGRENLDFARRT